MFIGSIERAGGVIRAEPALPAGLGHIAFSQTTVIHESPGDSCTTNTECLNAIPGPFQPVAAESACISGQCVVRHQTGTASAALMAFVDGDAFGAYGATLLVANKGEPAFTGSNNFVACRSSPTQAAYDWMISTTSNEGLRLATYESYNCTEDTSSGSVLFTDGVAQDYYARVHGVTVFKSAGNAGLLAHDPYAGSGISEQLACPLHTNAICVGSSNADGSLRSTSSWLNYQFINDDDELEVSDREEPDILGLGQAVQIADFTSTSALRTQPGNSFAAPSMAALLVLMQSRCEVLWTPRTARVLFVMAGRGRNAHSSAFSSPDLGIDYRDGGGVPNVNTMYSLCGLEPEDPAEDNWNLIDSKLQDDVLDASNSEPPPSWFDSADTEKLRTGITPYW